MGAASDSQQRPAIPLPSAVFCGNCETVTSSLHDTCSVCGSPSLVSLVRILGGSLHDPKRQVANASKYSVEMTARVDEIPVADLNLVLELLSRLTELNFTVESLHVRVKPVASRSTAKAA